MNILEKMRSLCHCGTCSRLIWCCVINILFPRVEYLWRLPLFMDGTQNKFLRIGSTAFATVATCSGLITDACKYRASQKKLWIVNHSPPEIITIYSNIIAPQDLFLFSCVTNCINFWQFPPENCPFHAPWDPLHPIMECLHLSAECMYNKCKDNQLSTFWRLKQACKWMFIRG